MPKPSGTRHKSGTIDEAAGVQKSVCHAYHSMLRPSAPPCSKYNLQMCAIRHLAVPVDLNLFGLIVSPAAEDHQNSPSLHVLLDETSVKASTCQKPPLVSRKSEHAML